AVNQQPITSFQLQDIGINIEITPQIHHDGLVTLEMKFELTFITNPGTERLPPTIGNRSVKTVIKLRDNETSILAGLLRDNERKAMRGLPFISRVPVLKEIFSGNKDEIEQTDIILTLTPRIIRFPEINEEDLSTYWVGTADRPGLKEPPSALKMDTQEPSPSATTPPTSTAAQQKKPPTPAAKTTTATTGPSKPQKAQTKPVQQAKKNKDTGKNTLSLKAPPGPIKSGNDISIALVLRSDADIKLIRIEL
ncbi:MAG: type II and III secretion system protein, partial [bacterium]|nr:type II and III secretion system protein [bacterium]